MPTLIDTSVWIQYFRADLPGFHRLLKQDLALGHPLVIGESACEQLKHRVDVLQSLKALPQAPALEFDEILIFVESHKLFGQGVGWVDVHLLTLTLLSDATLWTLARSFQRAAKKLHCSYSLTD